MNIDLDELITSGRLKNSIYYKKTIYLNSNKIHSIVHYNTNKKEHGNSKCWYMNGNLCYSLNFKNGKKDGIQKEYYSNGQLSTIYTCKNGITEGKKITIYRNKKLWGIEVFKDGSKIKFEKYYPKSLIKLKKKNKQRKINILQINTTICKDIIFIISKYL